MAMAMQCQRLSKSVREKVNVIESMATRECPTSIQAQFEHILKASTEMAAKLRLDEAFITSKGHPMEVDNVNEPAETTPAK